MEAGFECHVLNISPISDAECHRAMLIRVDADAIRPKYWSQWSRTDSHNSAARSGSPSFDYERASRLIALPNSRTAFGAVDRSVKTQASSVLRGGGRPTPRHNEILVHFTLLRPLVVSHRQRRQSAVTNGLRQHGHSPSWPLTSERNAEGCAMVMMARNASGSRCA